jgi:hypothetical protein
MLQTIQVTIHTFCLRDKDKKDKLGKERREESDEGKNIMFIFVKINSEIFPPKTITMKGFITASSIKMFFLQECSV